MNARQVAEQAGINRSFVYDIMRGRSENPNLDKLDQVAKVLNFDCNWLLHGVGDIEGESPIMEDPTQDPYATLRLPIRQRNISGYRDLADM